MYTVLYKNIFENSNGNVVENMQNPWVWEWIATDFESAVIETNENLN